MTNPSQQQISAQIAEPLGKPLTKNAERAAKFRALGKAISRYKRKNQPTAFDPWHAMNCKQLDDPALTSRLGNRFLRAHKSSKGPAHKTLQWEPTWKLREN